MSESLFCSKCGSQCQNGDCFCKECGNQLHKNEKNDLEEYNTNVIYEKNIKLSQKKKGNIAGFVLMVLGAVCLIPSQYDGIAKLGMPVMGMLFLVYGLVLLFKRVKKYGWGIGAIFTISILIASIYPFKNDSFMGSLVLSVILICLLLKANTKKKGE